jgi:predicted metal-dependent enzyme (double-stranded beta helix superfamily)
MELTTIGAPTPALTRLVGAVESALGDTDLTTDRGRAQAMVPALHALLADEHPIAPAAEEAYEGAAVGNLLHADPAGRFHILAVVFPEGTSSGIHHHGCWGVIGYLRGGDEETRYRQGGPDGPVEEASRHIWHQGDTCFLLPDEGEGWHRVRNPGPGTGVSVHVLCRTPPDHPHLFWHRDTATTADFPFVEIAPGRWRAEISD